MLLIELHYMMNDFKESSSCLNHFLYEKIQLCRSLAFDIDLAKLGLPDGFNHQFMRQPNVSLARKVLPWQ
jgi:hypothetical protein